MGGGGGCLLSHGPCDRWKERPFRPSWRRGKIAESFSSSQKVARKQTKPSVFSDSPHEGTLVPGHANRLVKCGLIKSINSMNYAP